MYPDEPTKALAKGRAITTTHSNNGWTIRTTRAPILSVAKRSLAADSQVAWKRELGLGRATNQELPEALYGRNLLALRHDASGVRLAFDASWRSARRSGAGRSSTRRRSRTGPWRRPSARRRKNAVAQVRGAEHLGLDLHDAVRVRVAIGLCVARRWRSESLIAAMACWWGRSTLEMNR